MTRICEFKDTYKTKWDDYINQSPAGSFYHLTGWKKIIEKTFGLKSVYLMALNENDEIEGVLPLFHMKDVLGRKYLISNPYSAYAGVCANDMTIKDKLYEKAKSIAIDKEVQYLELRQLGDEPYNLPTKKDFVTMFLKLSSDEEYVWKNSLNVKARNQVRKAYKEGLTVDFGIKYLDDFYRILSLNIRSLGSPNYPKTFLKNILQEFDNSSGIIVVKYREEIIGGMLFLHFKNIFLDPWASSLKKYNRLCPNDILYWEAIKYACRKDCEYFDFGRSTINSGTFKFKKKWGAETVQLNYQYVFNKAQTIPHVSALNNKYKMAITLWKKLPLTVTNILGPKLIKYLPEL